MWGALIIAVGISLFLVKYKVQGLEGQLAAKRAEIVRDRSEIRVLEAEWTYLNDPERLRRLSEQYLGLRPAVPENVTTMAALPFRQNATGAAGTASAAGAATVPAGDDVPLTAPPEAPAAPRPSITTPTATPVPTPRVTPAATRSPAGYPVIFARLQRLLFPEAVGATLPEGAIQ
jgi:hypothetical protein